MTSISSATPSPVLSDNRSPCGFIRDKGIVRPCPVQKQQYEIGRPSAGKRPSNPLGFDGFGGATQPGGVGNDHRVAAEIQPDVYDIAGSASGFGDDRHITPRQGIDKGAFSGVRWADHRQLQSLPQNLSPSVIPN